MTVMIAVTHPLQYLADAGRLMLVFAVVAALTTVVLWRVQASGTGHWPGSKAARWMTIAVGGVSGSLLIAGLGALAVYHYW